MDAACEKVGGAPAHRKPGRVEPDALAVDDLQAREPEVAERITAQPLHAQPPDRAERQTVQQARHHGPTGVGAHAQAHDAGHGAEEDEQDKRARGQPASDPPARQARGGRRGRR